MNSPLNFRSAAAQSLNQAQAARGVSAPKPAAPTQQTQQTQQAQRQAPGPASTAAPVHMAAEEMERHVSEALETSPVLNDEQAPLIDPEHLDNPPEIDDEAEVPEGDADDFEAVEFAQVEGKQEEEDYEKPEDKESESGVSRESYMDRELKLYLQDKATPAKRQAHLLKDHAGGNERPGPAGLAAALEGAVGGLARSLPGMAGDFVGLSEGYAFKSFGVLAMTDPNQLQAFVKNLRAALARPELDYLLLDLGRIPPSHQSYVLKTLPSCGAQPQKLLIWLGQGKRQWNS